MSKRKFKIIYLIFIVALTFRFIGIKHSFPFIFHPDEPTIIGTALGVRFDPNPAHFDWPHLYVYLNYFLYMLFAKFRNIFTIFDLRLHIIKLFPIIWDEGVVFYFLTRCFTATLGAATVFPIYLTAKKLFNNRVALISSFALAVTPFHIWHSHYALTDAPMVFLLAWALYFSSNIYSRNNVKDYMLAGLFVGFSASAKYNGGLAAVVVPLAYFLGAIIKKERVKIKNFGYLALSGIFAVFGFVLGTPYSVLDFKTFIRTDGPKGALWQFENVGSVSFSEHLVKFFADITVKIPRDTGYTIFFGFVLTLFTIVVNFTIRKAKERDYALILITLPAILYIWYISGFDKNRSHYYMISYPFIMIGFGNFIDVLVSKFKKCNLYAFLTYIAVFSLPLYFSVINSYTFYRGDTRNELYLYLLNNLKFGQTVIYNDRSLEDIVNKIGVYSKKGVRYVGDFDDATVLLANPYLNRAENEPYLNVLEQEHYISNNLRLGPDIGIYEIKK